MTTPTSPTTTLAVQSTTSPSPSTTGGIISGSSYPGIQLYILPVVALIPVLVILTGIIRSLYLWRRFRRRLRTETFDGRSLTQEEIWQVWREQQSGAARARIRELKRREVMIRPEIWDAELGEVQENLHYSPSTELLSVISEIPPKTSLIIPTHNYNADLVDRISYTFHTFSFFRSSRLSNTVLKAPDPVLSDLGKYVQVTVLIAHPSQGAREAEDIPEVSFGMMRLGLVDDDEFEDDGVGGNKWS